MNLVYRTVVLSALIITVAARSAADHGHEAEFKLESGLEE